MISSHAALTPPDRGQDRGPDRGKARSWTGRLLQGAFERAPFLGAATAFTLGAAALVVAAVPSAPLIPGFDLIEQIIDEAPEFTISITGVLLMALAIGLNRRLDTAWSAACVLLAFMAGYAVFRHEHYPAALLCVVALAGLAASRQAFYRHARLAALTPPNAWYLLVAIAAVSAIIGGLLWAGERHGFADAPWWDLVLGPHLGRPGRALIVATGTGCAIVGYRLLFSPIRRAPLVAGPSEMARAARILALAEQPRPDAHLAFLGDKSFLFCGDQAFVMFARSGGSLIAMSGPVGKRAAWREALAGFRLEAERSSMRPVIYGAPPDMLPDLLDLGFRVEKIGEAAIVDLKTFTMSGGKRQTLRTARRRFVGHEHAGFEIALPPHDSRLVESLKAVSDAWLARQSGDEKTFSLGRFDEGFIGRGPIAIVRAHGRLIAFATLWTTHDKRWISIDLMRHAPDAPHGLMDFLFAELILWAQAENYLYFDLGMAPLSGLAQERFAPLFARFGRFVFERAGALYNFEGLRKYKEKFAASWEPRYIAAPGGWSLPIVLAEAALLTAGGAGAMFRRANKGEAPVPSEIQAD